MPQRIGFVSTRFAGTDGVSLESAKWGKVLWDYQHISFWYSGRSDRSPDISYCVPEAFFGHPEVQWINEQIWGRRYRTRKVTERIQRLTQYLKSTFYRFVEQFRIDILIIENALCIPMHIPLGVALTEFLAETELPVIAHHHDFYWERERFLRNAAGDYIRMAFPPALARIQHVVINTVAREQLSFRTGLAARVIPNVMDFDRPIGQIDAYARDFRQAIGLTDDDWLVLQPTRVVARKGIEHAVELVRRLDDPRAKLVISHAAGDEGYHYLNWVREYAELLGVKVIFAQGIIGEHRQVLSDGSKQYTVADAYLQADLVTYPSTYEGFGNAFLEAILYKRPIMTNRYSIYRTDIEPKGFDVVAMDGFVTDDVVEKTQRLLRDEPYRREMVERNFELGSRFFSYRVLEDQLHAILTGFHGANGAF